MISCLRILTHWRTAYAEQKKSSQKGAVCRLSQHESSLLGIGLSVLSLIAFGADGFLIPAMLSILAVLTLLRKPLTKGGASA